MMGSREMTTKYRLAQWAEIIQERTASGETIDNFCLRKGISRNSYIYWLRKLRKTACEHLAVLPQETIGSAVQRFAEVKLMGSSMTPALIESNQVCIETGTYRVIAGSEYQISSLAALLRELAKQC